MEHINDPFGDRDDPFASGNAGDHFSLGLSHIGHAVKLAFCCATPGGKPQRIQRAAPPSASSYDDDDEEKSPRFCCIILPNNPWKEFWDLIILAFILYSAVMVPFRICFDATAVGNMFVFEQVVTFTFIIDCVFNFNQAYVDDETQRWVTDRCKIAGRYMSGWFWIDAPSSIPVELIDMYLLSGDNENLALLRFLRLFRLLRLMRLLKIGEYVAALEIKFDFNLTFLRIFQMVINMVFLAHMLGCFWFYCAALVGIDDNTVTWVSTYDDGAAVDAEPSVQYLYALYWALTTLTTVGYGDITPTNNLERIYTLFALLLGALVFGFILSAIGSLVQAVDRQAALSEERLDEVKEYMRWRRLPRDLVLRMRRYYTYYYTAKTAFDEQTILGNLTPALRFEVIQHALKETIGKIPLFANTLDPTFQMEVFPLLTPISAAPREVIFEKGDLSQGLFFLIKGAIDVISGVDGRVLYRVKPGSFFGEQVLMGRRRSATHRASSACEMMSISIDDLNDLLQKHPEEGRIIQHQVLQEHVRKERMRNLSLRMLILQLEKKDGGLSGPEAGRRLSAAAVKFQIAWNRACERAAFKASDYQLGKPGADGTPQLIRKPPTRKGIFGGKKDASLAAKIDKLEKKLDALTKRIK